MPNSGITPNLLLYQAGEGVTSAGSTLFTLFPVDDVAPPALNPETDVTPLIGKAEASFDAKAGVNFLQSLLEKLNMGKASFKAKLDDKDTLTFSFQDVKESSIDLLALDAFISGTPPDLEKFRSFSEKLKASELYVVTSVLKSNTFSVAITDKSGQNVSAEASLKGVLDAQVQVGHGSNHSITLSHKNKQVPLVFAFKAQRIIYDKPSFWTGKPGGFHIVKAIDVVMRNKGNYNTEPLSTGLQAADI